MLISLMLFLIFGFIILFLNVFPVNVVMCRGCPIVDFSAAPAMAATWKTIGMDFCGRPVMIMHYGHGVSHMIWWDFWAAGDLY